MDKLVVPDHLLILALLTGSLHQAVDGLHVFLGLGVGTVLINLLTTIGHQ